MTKHRYLAMNSRKWFPASNFLSHLKFPFSPVSSKVLFVPELYFSVESERSDHSMCRIGKPDVDQKVTENAPFDFSLGDGRPLLGSFSRGSFHQQQQQQQQL